MDTVPFLTLHANQIRDIAATIKIPDEYVAPKASPEAKITAIDACHGVGIQVPPSGAFHIAELDAAMAKVFPASDTLNIDRRLRFKATLSAGGLILEKSSVDKMAIVTAGLMLKKLGIPAPTDKPYTLADFDKLLASKDISIPHKLEIKNAMFAAGVVSDEGTVVTRQVTKPPIAHAKRIVEGLGLEMPESGKKIPIGKVDAAMDAAHWTKFEGGKEVRDMDRRVRAKQILEQAGVL
jgi:hypothetical protein